ncbi:HD-GYP domain-containing protein [Solidesulfovibrio sp.]|uniref:HD-GYP domain-containing protein n=1 Tax=Solidesulfovibrio sp. TaxID=2910990 RepID=UPI002B1F0D70|nr:HD-GYP domain-containing protein [Solidesulfovibrio sp.]MEA4858416.1 HD-GYP domain-containing protein [Solidesulfovibrio sp.]
MLRKIGIAELAVGMYVVDTGLSWLEHPFLYSQEGPVRDAGVLRGIVEAGYEEAFIDTDKGAFGTARAAVDSRQAAPLAAAAAALPSEGRAAARTAPLPLAQGLAEAGVLYRDCLAIAHDILREVQTGGEINVEASRHLVDDVIASAVRNRDALLALTKLRVHDAYTFTHGVNVAVVAVAFGSAMGLSPKGLKELGLAGLFHDVGKTGVPDAILNKPGRLTPEEFEQIKLHPAHGCRILADRGLGRDVLRGVGEHHEKFDGSGYPNGLSGAMVHPFGRILGVADVFDALTSKRSYKEAMLPTRALGVLYGMRDRDFPAGLVERFIKFLGPYPVGSFVRLSSGECGFVRGANPGRPLFPELLLVLDAAGRATPHRLLDLGNGDASGLSIVSALDPEAFGLDALACLTGGAE